MAYSDSSKDEDILSEAQDNFKETQDWESYCRTEMVDDQLFDDGNQWDEQVARRRNFEQRPTLTIPKTNQFTDRLKNEQRQNKPSIRVRPKTDTGSKKAADYRQGLLRHIQYKSKAQLAFQKAFNDAVTMGRGHFLITTKWVSDDSMDQDIEIDTIDNPLNVYMDKNHKEPDYSDCKYGFILERMKKAKFKEKYPDASEGNWLATDHATGWITGDDLQVADYYCQKIRKRELLLLEKDGESRTVFKDEIESDVDFKTEVKPYIVKKRKVDWKYWMWYKMTAVEILESRELKGIKEIPICTIIGKETKIEGRWNCKGIVRDLKDLQRMYNFWASQETELVSIAPRAPYIGAKGQFEGIPQWADANVTNYSYLEYKPISVNGTLAPAPQRQSMAQIPAGIVNAKMQITEDMKAVTGMYDAALGARSNETSGVAIKAREMQGDTANYHFIDNYANALNHAGRVINDMLPVYYDTSRVVTIMGDDEEEDQIQLGGIEQKSGERIELGEGEYDVIVEVGPTFTTRRQEAAATTLELMTKVPMVANIGGDLAVKMMDIPLADDLAGRLKKGIEQQFPGMTAPVPDDDKSQEQMLAKQLNEATQQFQQLTVQNQQLQEQIQKLDQTKIQSESQKVQNDTARVQLEKMEIEVRREIEMKKLEMEAMVADLNAEKDLKINSDKNEVELIKTTQQETKPEAPKPESPKAPPVNVTVNGTKVSQSKITGPDGEVYTVESEVDDGSGTED